MQALLLDGPSRRPWSRGVSKGKLSRWPTGKDFKQWVPTDLFKVAGASCYILSPALGALYSSLFRIYKYDTH